MQPILKLLIFLISAALLLSLLACYALWRSREAEQTSSAASIARLETDKAALSDEIDLLKNPRDGVAYHGPLHTEGAVLLDQFDMPFQLRGMSSHGLLWYPQYTNYRAIRYTKEHGANVFRAAMYTEGSTGYVQNPDAAGKSMAMALENTLGADMYVIADWHILSDGDPNTYVEKAVAFFSELSARYAEEAGLIYEICNEPNGDTDWADVCRYAQQVIPAIRSNDPDALIIVGTPKYCTDLTGPLADPLPYENVMYAYHYYTGFSKAYSYTLDQAREAGLPVFVSEWGINGGDADDLAKAEEFLTYLNGHSIGWVNWSLSNKAEDYSLLLPDCSALSGWDESSLTREGRFVIGALEP